MKCKSCLKSLPTKRIELGYKHCTECSTTEVYGTIDIVYHKTGNTVQHVSKETADHINKISKRPGFGSSLGRLGKGGYKEFSRTINVGASTAFVGNDKMFERIGEEAMFKLELLGLDKALDYIKRKHESIALTSDQYNKLKEVLTSFTLSK